jgi:hypothetical protein
MLRNICAISHCNNCVKIHQIFVLLKLIGRDKTIATKMAMSVMTSTTVVGHGKIQWCDSVAGDLLKYLIMNVNSENVNLFPLDV